MHEQASARRFGRFTVSSLLSAGVDLAAFALLCRLLESVIPTTSAAILVATVTARVLSSLVNYLINYFLVFESKASYTRSAGLYTGITVGKTLCSALLVAAAVHILPQLPRLAAKIPVDVLLFFVNYLLQKKFVY